MNVQRKTTWQLAMIVAVGAVLAPLYLAAQDDPPARVARIDRIRGDVSMMYPNSDGWTEAPPNYPLYSGARLYTSDYPSQAEIESGGTQIRAWNNSDVTLTNLMDGYQQIGLASGSIRVSVYSMNPGDQIEIDTPNGAVLVQQPGSYRIDAFPWTGASDLVVSRGTAVVAAPGGLNQEVGNGQAVQLYGSNPTQMVPVGYPQPDGLDQWSSGLDNAYNASISRRYVSPYLVGFADLDANGSWNQESEYGPVWYPNAGPGWRPYSVGHWAYVAPWGYTWIDDASWGYAPFHYGRWVNVRDRWGWVPGPRDVRPVYSPALVAFVGGAGFSLGVGGGSGVAAWFPLGVGEPYVPWYRCSPSYARNVNVTNVNITYIHDTTIVNNFNTFVTNTRTATNVRNIEVRSNYVNRSQAVVVPAAAMSSGRSVSQAQIKVTPDVQRQLASAPVKAEPSAPPPSRPMLAAKTTVKAPTVAPTLLTPRGPAKATPQANVARQAPAPLPKPAPAATLAKPVAGVVAGKPPASKPAAPMPSNAAQQGVRPGGAPGGISPQPENRNNTPAARQAPPEASPRTVPPAQEARPAGAMPEQRQPATQPENKQNPATERKVPVPPESRPAPPEQRPAPPEQRPAPPEQRPTPPEQRPAPPEQRPAPPEQRPTPPEQRQAPREERPNPPQERQAPPESRPTPPPEQRQAPPEQRQAPPEQRHAPPEQRPAPPEQRPAPPESRPAPPEQRQAPPAAQKKPPEGKPADKKPEDKKPEDK